MINWEKMITTVLRGNKETWEDVESCTLSDAELKRDFYSGFGWPEGEAFYVWTKRYVYFACCYDGSEWVEYVPRHPTDETPRHIGG